MHHMGKKVGFKANNFNVSVFIKKQKIQEKMCKIGKSKKANLKRSRIFVAPSIILSQNSDHGNLKKGQKAFNLCNPKYGTFFS